MITASHRLLRGETVERLVATHHESRPHGAPAPDARTEPQDHRDEADPTPHGGTL